MTASDLIRESFQAMLDRLTAAEEELGKLDAAAGDGDHGTGMTRGMRAAVAALEAAPLETPVPQLFMQAGSAFSDAAGGSSGALYGMMIMTIGQKIGAEPSRFSLATALAAGRDAVARLGKAKVGDKTLLDTLDPFVTAFAAQVDANADLVTGWQAALPAAEAGAAGTAEMVAKRGRSSKLAERSLGHPDPGAYSMLYMLQAVGEVLTQHHR
ncbi:MAG: dihydroxyacetone kinase subunit L [Caldilineaceae bacterium]|nr:dihydroxyacetone kinase subunit L [Caldilineaceae bacterium]